MSFSVGSLIGYLELQGSAAFNQGVTTAQRGLDLTADSAKLTGEALTKTEAGLAGAGRQADVTANSSAKLRAAQLSLTAAQERYNVLLEQGDASVGRLASAEATLIRANERVKASMPTTEVEALGTGSEAAATKVGLFKEKLTGAVETAAKFGIMLGGFELLMKGIELAKSGLDLTTALNATAAAAGATDEEMVKVRATAIALGHDLTVPGATAVDAADAITDLVKSGVSLERAMVAARPALLLASAANVTMAESAQVVGDVMDDFALSGDQAAHVADIMAAAANHSSGGLMDLFDALKYVGPQARGLGLDVDSTTAAITELAKSGIQGSMAGTSLRMMLQKLAQQAPATKAALEDMGVSAFDAQDRLIPLPDLFDQLHAAQERLNPQQFGADVANAFGARASAAVTQFAHEGSEGFQHFFDILQAGNVQQYADKMNRGLSAAGAQIKKELTSWAIDGFDKIEPALVTAADWFANGLPRAVSQTEHAIDPLAHEVGAVIVPAWHGLSDVLRVIAGALGEVDGFLNEHRGILTVVGSAVLGMWAAYKGYTIAKDAVKAVSDVLDTVALKALYARDSLAAIGTAESPISAAGIAVAGIGLALGLAAFAWTRNQAAVAANKAAIESYTRALEEDNNAIGDNTRLIAFNNLQKSGAIDAAKKLGLSLDDVTSAALGNKDAQAKLNEAYDAFNAKQKTVQDTALHGTGVQQMQAKAALEGGNALSMQQTAWDQLNSSIGTNNKQLQAAIQNEKDKQAAGVKTTDAVNDNTAAVEANADAQAAATTVIDGTTVAMKGQKAASDVLSAALALLSGDANAAAEAQLALEDNLGSVAQQIKDQAKQYKDAGTSMDENTEEGRKNLEWLHQQIDQINTIAEAQYKSTGSVDDATASMQKNTDALKEAAKKAGLNADAVQALLDKYAATPDDVVTYMLANADSADSTLSALNGKLSDLQNNPISVSIYVDDNAFLRTLSKDQQAIFALASQYGTVTLPGQQSAYAQASQYGNPAIHGSGGVLVDGWNLVGDKGPELVNKQTGRVLTAAQTETALRNQQQGGAGMPSTLVIVDQDGQLIGRMRVEAQAVSGATARSAYLTGGRR